MSTLICAVNLWSCGLACVEAILADNGVPKTQNEIIQSFKGGVLLFKK